MHGYKFRARRSWPELITPWKWTVWFGVTGNMKRDIGRHVETENNNGVTRAYEASRLISLEIINFEAIAVN